MNSADFTIANTWHQKSWRSRKHELVNNHTEQIITLTEGHPTETLEKGDEYSQSQIAVTWDVEDCQHTQEH